MDNEIDKAFLQSMMSDRKASMSGKDNTVFSQEKRKLARKNQKSKRKEIREHESAISSTAVLSDSTTTDSNTNDEMSLCPTTFFGQVTRSNKRSVKTGGVVRISTWHLKSTICCSGISSEQNFFIGYFCYNVWDCGNIRKRSIRIIFNFISTGPFLHPICTGGGGGKFAPYLKTDW